MKCSKTAALKALTATAAACALLTACGGGGSDSNDDAGSDALPAPEPLAPRTGQGGDGAVPNPQGTGLSSIDILLDGSLTADQKKFVRDDFEFIRNVPFRVAPNSYFSQAFKGTTASSVLRYLDERIRYLIAPNVNVSSRLVQVAAMTGEESDGGSGEQSVAETIATNVGTAYWLQTLGFGAQVGFNVGNGAVPLSSSRVGLVQLGNSYFNFANSGRMLHRIARTSVLVHEARHSDCTGGLPSSDRALWASDSVKAAEDLQNPSCGHLHFVCPAGHQYAGLTACDGAAWGAYAMGYLYADGIVESCKVENCTEKAKQVAEAVRLDSLDRIAPSLRTQLDESTLPAPDMSSSVAPR